MKIGFVIREIPMYYARQSLTMPNAYLRKAGACPGEYVRDIDDSACRRAVGSVRHQTSAT